MSDFVDLETGEVFSDHSEAAPARDKPRLTVEAYLRKLIRKGQNVDGSEILDPVPLAPPIGWAEPMDMVEIIRSMVRSEAVRMAAEAGGHDTFEESDDFDVADDDEPYSAYEMDDDYEPVHHFRRRMEAAEAAAAVRDDPPGSDLSSRPPERTKKVAGGEPASGIEER